MSCLEDKEGVVLLMANSKLVDEVKMMCKGVGVTRHVCTTPVNIGHALLSLCACSYGPFRP